MQETLKKTNIFSTKRGIKPVTWTQQDFYFTLCVNMTHIMGVFIYRI